jgi:hypothetical protein
VPREIEVAERALDAARAEQARDEKTLQFTAKDTEKGIHEARSELDAARARLVLAEADEKRYATLFCRCAGHTGSLGSSAAGIPITVRVVVPRPALELALSAGHVQGSEDRRSELFSRTATTTA